MTDKIIKFHDNHFLNSFSLTFEKIKIDKNFLISNGNAIKKNFYNKNNFKKINNFYSMFKILNELNDEYYFKEKQKFNKKFQNFKTIINCFYDEKEIFFKEKQEKLDKEIKIYKEKINDLTNLNLSLQNKKNEGNVNIIKIKKISKGKNLLIKILTFNFYDKNKCIESKIKQGKNEINILENDITKLENKKGRLELDLKQNLRKHEILNKEINNINEYSKNIDFYLIQAGEILNKEKLTNVKINDKVLPPVIAIKDIPFLKIEINSIEYYNQPSTSGYKPSSPQM